MTLSGMDYGYVTPWISLLVMVLMIVALLLVGLAWHSLRAIRQDLRSFLDTEYSWREAAALERERLDDALSKERKQEYLDFRTHRHDPTGKVVL
jgi:hypothetical protein